MINRTHISSPVNGKARQERDINGEAEVLAVAAQRSATPEERAQLRESLVLLALPLADAMARRYAGRGIETDDLIQVARTALVQAVDRYRPGTGPGFVAFAVPTVSGELKRWFRDHGWSVRPPRRVQELRPLLIMEEERLRRLLSRDPSEDELAAAMGVDRREVAEVRLCMTGYHAASLDTPSMSDGCLADHLLITECPTQGWDTSDALGQAVARLTERQRLILRMRFVEERTQHQIGAQIGVSQMQVSRLLRAIVDQLRRDLGIDDGMRDAAA